MSLTNAVAKLPMEIVTIAGAPAGVVAGLGGGWIVSEQLGADPINTACALAGGGSLAGVGGMVSMTAVQRIRNGTRERFIVDGSEQVARSTMELMWGRAGARVVCGLGGLGVGTMMAGALLLAATIPASGATS